MMRAGQSQVISVILLSGIAVMVVSGAYFWGAPLMEKSQAGSRLNTAENMMASISDAIDEVAKQGGQVSIPLNLGGTLRVLEEENAIAYEVQTASLNVASRDWVPLDGMSPIRQDTIAATTGEPFPVGDATCSVTGCDDSSVTLECADGEFGGGTFTNEQKIDVEGEEYEVFLECDNEEYNALLIGPEERAIGYVGVNKAGVLIGRAFPVGDQYKNMYKLVYRELDDMDTEEGYRTDIRSAGGTVGNPGKTTLTVRKGEVEAHPASSGLGGALTTTQVLLSIQ